MIELFIYFLVAATQPCEEIDCLDQFFCCIHGKSYFDPTHEPHTLPFSPCDKEHILESVKSARNE